MMKFPIHNRLANFIILLFVCLQSNILTAKNYYISTKGKNSNSGTYEQPFRTIQFGIDQLKPGDKCYIREGIYRENVVFHKSGKKRLPLSITNYKNEQVTIAPIVVTQKWKCFKNKIYRIPCKGKVLQLFINGKPSMQACYPNIIEGDMSVKSWGSMDAFPDKTIYFSGLSKFKNLKGCHFTGLSSNGLVALNGKITNQIGDEITLKNDAFYWNKTFINNYLGTGKGFITGDIKFLDHHGEWFQKDQFLYFFSKNGNPNEYEISVRKNIHQLIIDGKSYIKINGINLFGCSFRCINSENCSFSNGSILYPSPFFFFESGWERIWNKKNDADDPLNWSGKGVEISGKNNIINNTYVAHSWGDGMTISGIHNNVKNCIIYDCNWMAIDCAPLYILGKNHLVSNCTFSRSSRSVLVNRKLEKSKIIYNEIKEGGLLCDDLGLTYCYEIDGKGTEIAFNWIHDNHAPFYGSGIYLDNGHKNFIVHHNVVWNCFIGMTINEPCENDIIAHNTFFQNKYSMSCWPPRPNGNVNIRTYNNITDSDLKSAWHQAFHGSITDSNYVSKNIYTLLNNPNERLFDLRDDSYPIDKGIIYKKNFPYLGKAPDLGAYEKGRLYWIPGSNLKITNLLYEPSPDSEFETVEKNPIIEFVYTFVIFLLLVFILLKWKFIRSTGINSKTILSLFGIKILFSFTIFWIYKYYYLNTNTADIFKYFEDAKVLNHYIFKNSPLDYLKFIFGFHVDSPDIQEAILHTKHWVKLVEINALNDNQTIIRLHAILLLFSNGYFHIHTLIFCFISFIGCIFLFKFFKILFPQENTKLIVGIFLIPSVLFWSSGVLKESILIFGIGIFVYHWCKIIYKYPKPLLSIILIVGSLYLIMILKSYVIIAMIPSLISWFIIQRGKLKYFLPTFIFIHTAFIIILFQANNFVPSFNFMEHLIFKQNDFICVANEMHAQSKIDLPLIDHTYNSLINSIPNAIYNVFYQPEFKSISSSMQFLAFLENIAILLLIGMSIFFFKKPAKNQRIVVWFTLFYTLFLSILIGWVVPISGAIVRYKIPFLPFLVVCLLICINTKKIKLIFTKTNFRNTFSK